MVQVKLENLLVKKEVTILLKKRNNNPNQSRTPA